MTDLEPHASGADAVNLPDALEAAGIRVGVIGWRAERVGADTPPDHEA